VNSVQLKTLFWSVTAAYLNGLHFDALGVAESELTFRSTLTCGQIGKLLWTGGVDPLSCLQSINVTTVGATFGLEKAR
jgi:hypothetical protein